ncbi:MAG: lysophospholipid acyltransferase family protein [Pseudomonadota bacterium]
MLLVRSLIFQVWMYGLMAILGVVFAPLAIWSRDGAYFAISIYLRLVFWGLQAICGLTAETRGEIPEGDVLIAAKHQSFLDVLILVRDLPAAKFVMKRSLVWAPILGFYALRIGASPVTRGKGAASVEEMVEEAEKRRALSGQLVIYPQGTRVAPDEAAPYKRGAWHLYRSYGLPCVPAAVNTGVFWPRKGVARRPGRAVVELAPALPAGMEKDAFLQTLETTIENASGRLLAEAKAQASGT